MKRKTDEFVSRFDKTFETSRLWDFISSEEQTKTMSLRQILENPSGLHVTTVTRACVGVLREVMDFIDEHEKNFKDLEKSVPQKRNPRS